MTPWIRATVPGVLLAAIGVMVVIGVQIYSDVKVRRAPAEYFVHDEDDLDNAGTIIVVRVVGMGITVFGLGAVGLSAGLAVLLRAK